MTDSLRRPAYARLKRGNLHWEPPAWAREMGFQNVALGRDGHEARARAEDWNKKLEDARKTRGAEQRTMPYPQGSLGHWWLTWKTLPSYLRKGAGTRAEFEEAWKRIGPALGSKPLAKITPAEVEEFQVALEESVTAYRRWSIIKKLRGIFNAAIAHRLITQSPATTLPNPQPEGRSVILRPEQMTALFEAARPEPGMWLVLRIMYEAAVSPIDARSVERDMLIPWRQSGYISRDRTKTGQSLGNALSASLWADIAAYLEASPVALGPIFRRADGTAWKDRRAFNYDFAKIRKQAGLPAHIKPLDIRRTANLEAALGDAKPEERAKFLANTLDRNKRLEKTYTPETVELSLTIAEKREIGRQYLKSAS